MNRSTRLSIALLALSSTAAISPAQDTGDLKKEIEQLKQQQKAMQEQFEKKIDELEKKLDAKQKAPADAHPIKTEVMSQLRYDFDSAGTDSFYTRRIEIKFSGQVNPKVSWAVMFDPAKTLKQDANGNVDQTSRMLQDATISFALGGPWSVDVGQKKTPFSAEALQKTSELDTLERTLFLAQGHYGDVRDQGLWINAKFPEVEATAAVLNGVGENQNQRDLNDQKSYGFRAVYKPKSVAALQVGASFLTGQAPTDQNRERAGLDAVYKKDGLTLKSEVATALTDGVRGRGWYGHVGYMFQPKLEGVLRYDRFDPNLENGGDDVTDTTLGINYYIQGHDAKLQLNWVNRLYGDNTHRSLWEFGVQTRW